MPYISSGCFSLSPDGRHIQTRHIRSVLCASTYTVLVCDGRPTIMKCFAQTARSVFSWSLWLFVVPARMCRIYIRTRGVRCRRHLVCSISGVGGWLSAEPQSDRRREDGQCCFRPWKTETETETRLCSVLNIISCHIVSKSHDLSARNTTRVPNNMQKLFHLVVPISMFSVIFSIQF